MTHCASPAAQQRSWQVYILRCARGTLYTGVTTDLTRRLKAHNSGRGAAYMRRNGPGELVYLEAAASRGDALRREAAIKKFSRARKLGLLGAPCNLLQKSC